MEEIAGGRVINNDAISKLSVQTTEILHKNPVEERTVLSEQPIRAESIFVQKIKYGVRVLRQWSCVDDQLVALVHASEELINPWPLLDKHVADLAVDLNLELKVASLDRGERAMDESFV